MNQLDEELEAKAWADRNGLDAPAPTDRVWRGLTPAEALARSEHRDYPAADCYEEIPQLPGWVWALFALATTFGAAFLGYLLTH